MYQGQRQLLVLSPTHNKHSQEALWLTEPEHLRCKHFNSKNQQQLLGLYLTQIATTQPTKQCKTTWLVWYYYRLKKPHHTTTPHHHTTPGLITI